MTSFLNGFLIGGSLIVAIGSQNAYVLKQGLLRSHIFIICLICSLSDALLIILGTSGVGKIISSYPTLINYIAIFGALFLFVYGLISFRDAFFPKGDQQGLQVDQQNNRQSLKKAVLTVLALTFLNPHVYLDTLLLIGSIASPYLGTEKIYFTAGAISASFIWFFSLGYGARLLTPLFAKAITWKILNIIIGIIMWSIAWMLMPAAFL